MEENSALEAAGMILDVSVQNLIVAYPFTAVNS